MRVQDLAWGGLLVLVGVLFLLSNFGILPFSIFDVFRYGWPLILVAAGVLVILGGFGSRATNTLSDHTIRYDGKPIRSETLNYSLGEYDIHLTGAEYPEGTANFKISHGVGDLRIWVPRELALKVRAGAGIGDVRVFEMKDDGFSPKIDFSSPGYATATRRLQLEANVGLGDVNIQYGTNGGA